MQPNHLTTRVANAPRLPFVRGALAAAIVVLAALALSGPASAETITGSFSYSDTYPTEPASIGARPIAGAFVEIFRGTPTIFGTSWSRVQTAWTDEAGSFSVYVSHRVKGAKYQVRVHALNEAATTGHAVTPAITRVAWAFTDILEFNPPPFTGADRLHFNAVETLRYARAYAVANRDPRESDAIPRVTLAIGPTATGLAWYDPVFDTLRLEPSDAMDDHLLLHEYAHFLQEQISSFAWIPAYHDGCVARDAAGNVINSSEHAWMEGFADFFAQVVATRVPHAGFFDGGGTIDAYELESQPARCDVPVPVAGSGIEYRVAGSLWDVFDGPFAPSFLEESHDSLEAMDNAVFEIVDHELDVYGTWPTMYAFREAWWGRGLPVPALDRIVGHHGIAGPFLPTPIPPGSGTPDDPGDTIDPCDLKPWMCEDPL